MSIIVPDDQSYNLELKSFGNYRISFCTVSKEDSPSLYVYLVSRDEYFDPKRCWPGTVGEKIGGGGPEKIRVCFHNGPHADMPGHLTSQPLVYAQWLSQFQHLMDTPLKVNLVKEEELDNLILFDKQKSEVLYVEVDEADIKKGLRPIPLQFAEQMKINGYRVLATNSLSADPANDNISLSGSNHFRLTQAGILIVERMPKVAEDTITFHALTMVQPDLDAVVLKISS